MITRRQLVAAISLGLSGCLRNIPDNESDDSIGAQDEDVGGRTGNQCQQGFETGEFPDDGSHFVSMEDRFVSYTGFLVRNPVQARFLNSPSEDEPAIIRLGLSNTDRILPEDEHFADPPDHATLFRLPKNGPLTSYEPGEFDETPGTRHNVHHGIQGQGVGSFKDPVADEGDIVLVSLDSGYSYEEGCWTITDPGSPEETIEYELPEVEEPGEFSIFQDYALISKDQCLPRGVYEFEFPGTMQPGSPFVLTVSDELEKPQPESSRFYDDVPGEIDTDQNEPITLYHGIDEDAKRYMEPTSETIGRGDGEITYRTRSYSHDSTGFSGPYWWRIYRYEDEDWQTVSRHQPGTGLGTTLLPGQYYDSTLTLQEGVPQVEGQQPQEPQALEPGIHALVYPRTGPGFAFEVEE